MTISCEAFARHDESKSPKTIEAFWNTDGTILVEWHDEPLSSSCSCLCGIGALWVFPKELDEMLANPAEGQIFDQTRRHGMFRQQAQLQAKSIDGTIEITDHDLTHNMVRTLRLSRTEWKLILDGAVGARGRYLEAMKRPTPPPDTAQSARQTSSPAP